MQAPFDVELPTSATLVSPDADALLSTLSLEHPPDIAPDAIATVSPPPSPPALPHPSPLRLPSRMPSQATSPRPSTLPMPSQASQPRRLDTSSFVSDPSHAAHRHGGQGYDTFCERIVMNKPPFVVECAMCVLRLAICTNERAELLGIRVPQALTTDP